MEYLYYLTYTIEDNKHIFYCGRTNDLDRRLGEHKRQVALGTEDKYVFIREHLIDIPWCLEVIKTINKDEYPSDYEAFYVMRAHRDGHKLTNMKAGDEYRRMVEDLSHEVNIETIESFVKHKKIRELGLRKSYQAKLDNRVLLDHITTCLEHSENIDWWLPNDRPDWEWISKHPESWYNNFRLKERVKRFVVRGKVWNCVHVGKQINLKLLVDHDDRTTYSYWGSGAKAFTQIAGKIIDLQKIDSIETYNKWVDDQVEKITEIKQYVWDCHKFLEISLKKKL